MIGRWVGGVLFGLLLALAPLGARALDVRSEEDFVLPATATVEDDLLVNGVVVRIEGRVRGDLYVVAQYVDVTGPVDGDVVVIAHEASLHAPVGGNVRAAGGALNLTAPVARNVSAAVGALRVGSGARVGGSVTAWTRDEPPQVGGDATVGGPVEYWSDGEAVVGPGTRTGAVRRHDPPRLGLGPRATATLRSTLGWLWLAWVLGTGLSAAVAASVLPGAERATGPANPAGQTVPATLGSSGPAISTETGPAAQPARGVGARAAAIVSAQPLGTALVGLAAAVLTPAAALLLALTVVGLPLAIALALLWPVGLLVGWAVAGALLGRLVALRLPWSVAPWRSAIGGTLLLGLAASVPLLGALVAMAALVVGVGVLLLSLRSSRS